MPQRVSKKILTLSMHSFGVGNTQILWKKVKKKSKMAAEIKKSVETAILGFLKKNPQNLRLTNIKWMQKENWKNVGYSQRYVKISVFDSPFSNEPP
jgi:hypothetical protein